MLMKHDFLFVHHHTYHCTAYVYVCATILHLFICATTILHLQLGCKRRPPYLSHVNLIH
jgi:hypothetical protein